jgi:hypothetical protein
MSVEHFRGRARRAHLVVLNAWLLLSLASSACHRATPRRAGMAGDGGPGGGGGIEGSGGDAGGRDGAVDASSDAGVAGGGGAGGNAGSLCQSSPPFDRSCTSDTDCVAAIQNGCRQTYVGLRNGELARFQAYQQECNPPPAHGTSGPCDVAPLPPVTDDGSQVDSSAAVAVACRAGTCATYSSLCGHVCDRGTSCFSCPTVAGTIFAACTARCSAFTSCTDPGSPSCQSTLVGNTQPQFCVPEGVICKLCTGCPPPPDAGAASDALGEGATAH